MNDNDELIQNATHQAQVLGIFKTFCDTIADDPKTLHNIRNIMHRSNDKEKTVSQIFEMRLNIDVEPEDLPFMLELVTAFLRKSTYRKPISSDIRADLIKKQNGCCVFCGNHVNQHDPVDHIVPFKYVGDELKDNYQILCKSCNSHKGESIDYQIKVLLQI